MSQGAHEVVRAQTIDGRLMKAGWFFSRSHSAVHIRMQALSLHPREVLKPGCVSGTITSTRSKILLSKNNDRTLNACNRKHKAL